MDGNQDVKRPSFVKRHNIIPMIICVLAAFFIWIYVAQTDSVDAENTFTGVTVQLIGQKDIESDNLYVYSGEGSLVDVTVVGRKSIVRDFTADDIRVTANLSSIDTAGEHSVRIDVDLPNGLSLSSLSADTITVRVDEKMTKNIDVTARLVSGIVAENYSLGVLEPKFKQISVTGPKTVIDDISGAVIRLELGAITTSMTATAAVELTSYSGNEVDMRNIYMSYSEMEVEVPLFTVKTVPLTVDMKYGYLNGENSKITVTPEYVTLKGDPGVLSSLESLNVATIDEKSIGIGGEHTQFVDVKAPNGTEIENGTLRAVVRIEHVGTVTKTYSVSSFTVRDDSSIKYEILDESVAVVLRGTLADLGKITAKDITATIDLSEYEEKNISGEMVVPLEISVSSDTVYEIGAYTIQVRIG